MKLLYGVDVLDGLKTLPDESVHCCVTSPPYWGLRDYGKDGQIGLEKTPDEYVEKMVAVFREVKRVLRNDGTLWLNLGDSYAGSGQGWGKDKQYAGTKQATNKGSLNYMKGIKNKTGFSRPTNYISSCQNGIKPKDLSGIPWMVAFALRADGWYLRQDIIWHKPNPMPESVTDRCTKSHEYIFLLSKSSKYFYDYEAIQETITDTTALRLLQDVEHQKGSSRVPGKTNGPMKAVGKVPSNWHQGKRFNASMGGGGTSFVGHSGYKKADGELLCNGKRNKRSVWTVTTKGYPGAHFATFPQDLIIPMIQAGCPRGGVVLDPFSGSGTTGEVALGLGRDYIGIDLNKDYEKLAQERFGLFLKG